MVLRVSRSALTAIREHAARDSPAECCGLLFGLGTTIEAAQPARNVAADPIRRFEIDPQALVGAHRAARGGGPELIGYYHSHPSGLAEPSAADRAEAGGDGRVWAIIGASDVTFWRDDAAGFAPLSYQVEDR